MNRPAVGSGPGAHFGQMRERSGAVGTTLSEGRGARVNFTGSRNMAVHALQAKNAVR